MWFPRFLEIPRGAPGTFPNVQACVGVFIKMMPKRGAAFVIQTKMAEYILIRSVPSEALQKLVSVSWLEFSL